MNQTKPSIFISWSKPLAEYFAKEYKKSILRILNEDDVNVFFSQDLKAGRNPQQEIRSALAKSVIGLVILTPDSIQSPWLLVEAGAIAMSGQVDRNKVFLPLVVGIKSSDKFLENFPFKPTNQYKKFRLEDNYTTIEIVEDIIKKILETNNISYGDETEDKVKEEGKKLHNRLGEFYQKWKNGHKTHNNPIELIHYRKDTDQFKGFIGNFIAFNAPLAYEQRGAERKALDEHITRYNQDNVKAEYFYPIFAILENDVLLRWLKNIYGFFKELNNELSREAKGLLDFYVPKFENGIFVCQSNSQTRFGYDIGFTFFVGDKKNDSNLVCIYMHNRIYSDMTTGKEPYVEKYFVLREQSDQNDVDLHRQFIDKENFRTRDDMKRLDLESFIDYCLHIQNTIEQKTS